MRPDSRTVTARLVAYLFRTGKLDWAGGRQAEYEKRFGRWRGTAFDGLLREDDEAVNVPVKTLFAEGMTPREAVANLSKPVSVPAPLAPLASGATYEIKPFRATVQFFPFGPPKPEMYGPPLPPRPLGFWPLVEHNFSIGYAGDIRACREEAARDGDTEAVEICDQLLAMKRTAREKVGDLVEAEIDRRGR